jgi:hypothetical protein
MGKPPFAAVQRVFIEEAVRTFRFLIDEFGFSSPEVEGFLLSTVSFLRQDLQYRIMLDPTDRAVVTRVQVRAESKVLIADLDDIVHAAGLGARNHVARSARTLVSFRKSLEAQARFVRLLQPRMDPDGAVQLMRASNARDWTAR